MKTINTTNEKLGLVLIGNVSHIVVTPSDERIDPGDLFELRGDAGNSLVKLKATSIELTTFNEISEYYALVSGYVDADTLRVDLGSEHSDSWVGFVQVEPVA